MLTFLRLLVSSIRCLPYLLYPPRLVSLRPPHLISACSKRPRNSPVGVVQYSNQARITSHLTPNLSSVSKSLFLRLQLSRLSDTEPSHRAVVWKFRVSHSSPSPLVRCLFPFAFAFASCLALGMTSTLCSYLILLSLYFCSLELARVA